MNICFPSRAPLRRGASLLLAALCACESAGPPTWSGEVAEVVHASCASCHRPDGPAPFALLTYDDARAVAVTLADAVAAGRMPPWLPAPGPSFAGDRRLDPEARDLLVDWVAAGTPRGDSTREPAPPQWPSGWALGEPDLVLETSQAFPVPATGGDQFRNFVLPIPGSGPRWVRAVELRPDPARVVHHATMRVDDTPSSRLADARDSLPGFDEMFSRANARPPGGFFLGWTPGRVPSPNPPGMYWPLVPGTDFIVQLHLRPVGEAMDVGARVGFWFADEPPDRIPTIVRLGSQTLDIPAGAPGYVVEDAFELPVAVEAIGAYPHAHYLGRSVESWGELPDGERIDLMEIPAWDFNWQDAYRYQEPVRLPAGTRLHLRWTFDNTADNPRNPNSPPARVVYGPTSGDEMAEFWLQVVPVHAVEAPRLEEAMARKAARDQLEGWRHLVALDSTDAQSWFGLGTAAQAAGDLVQARRHYERALRWSPDLPQAHFNLGLIREAVGDPVGAEAAYRRAIDLYPAYGPALANLGRLLAASDRRGEAREVLELAVAADSTAVDALTNLGALEREEGRPGDALPLLERAVAHAPERAAAHFSLALALAETGRAEAALERLNQGLAIQGDALQPVLDLAWILVADPDPDVRRPDLGGGLAQEVYGRTGPHPVVSDLLAAAHAATGDYDRAAGLAREALAAPGVGARAPAIEARLRLYEAGRPFHLPAR